MKNPSLLAVCLSLAAPLLAADLSDLKLKDIQAGGAPAAEAGQAVATTGGKGAKEIDLLPQLTGASNRDQCSVGSCHAFSSIAVLEAAYNRKHGEKIRFSEADIFMRRTVLSKALYDEFCATGKCKLTEGNDVIGDIRYAIENGVASDLEYRDFLDRYLKYRAAEVKTLEGIEKRYQEMGWLEKLFYDPRAHWAELQNAPQSKKILESFLRGNDPKVEAQRADSAAKLKGFVALEKSFAYLGDKAGKTSKADCKKAGVPQGDLILKELHAVPKGRPVSISMSLSGLPSWGQTDVTQHANHAIAIVGYRMEEGKGAVFKTRNSWGANENHDVQEDELCRIYRIVTVLTPEESAQAAK